MLSKPELACFVIADISGYTKFLAASEIEHAQDIIADFMDTVVKGLRPPFRLAKFEGDAAFVYAVSEKIDSSLLQDTIEQAYFKFRRRLRDVKQASSCECKACAAMGDLDFKFVVHHGEMVKQKMGGREELAGRDVILVHRLLKNAVSEKVGGRAYALYSDACIQTMGIDPAAQGLIEHQEAIDIIGDVKLWLRDLEEAWRKENEQTRVEVTRADSYMTLEYDIAAPRQKVWEYFTVPGQWQSWWPADAIIENSSKGRRGVGTRESLHAWQGRDYRGDARLAPVRLLNGEHSSSDPGRAENRDDPCGAGQPERRYAPGISGRQAKKGTQGLCRSGRGKVHGEHE